MLNRLLFAAVCFLILEALVLPTGRAQETQLANDRTWGPAWHDPQEVPSIAMGDTRTVSLTVAQGMRIRREVEMRLRAGSFVGALSAAQRRELRGRRVGPLWLSDGRPRVGAFWIQRRTDHVMSLSQTLVLRSNVRVMLNIEVELRRGRWRVRSATVSFVRRR